MKEVSKKTKIELFFDCGAIWGEVAFVHGWSLNWRSLTGRGNFEIIGSSPIMTQSSTR